MNVLLGQMVRCAVLVNIMILGLTGNAMSQNPIQPPGPPVRIVALGDSLTAGFGLKPGQGFPEQLAKLLKARGHNAEVANAGVSGDTTAGGRHRLDWAVPEGTDAVILELGANDALRGNSTADARRNLEAIVVVLKARNIDILIAGMRAPRNLGNDYANAFDAIFPELADKHATLLYPFFLAGVALDPRLNLADGLHPTAEGVAVITQRIAPKVEELILAVRTRKNASGGAPTKF